MNTIILITALVLSIVAMVESIWSPRLVWLHNDEFDAPHVDLWQLWLFYNYRKKVDKMLRRKGVQIW